MQLAMLGNSPMARQLTPPDSPEQPDHAMLPPIKTEGMDQLLAKTSGKMSLDFIAPNGRTPPPETAPSVVLPRLEALGVLSEAAAIHRGSRPSSPLHASALMHPAYKPSHSPIHPRPQVVKREYLSPASSHTSSLPSPEWSSHTNSLPIQDRHALHFNLRYHDRRLSHPGYGHRMLCRSPIFMPHGTRSSRVQKASKTVAPTARGERHPYDPEERFALIYWRRETGEKKLEWKDCEARFAVLFPPGTPRRWQPTDSAQARGLPSTYPERNIQGLQCRFYRIRTEEKMPQTRKALASTPVGTSEGQAIIENELQTLKEVVTRHGFSPSFVRTVEQLAVKGDLNQLTYGLARL